MGNAGVLGNMIPTRSPGEMPACSSSVATRAAASCSSAKVNCTSSQRSAMRSGLRSFDATRLVLSAVILCLWDIYSSWDVWAFPDAYNRALGELAQQCRREQHPGRFDVAAHSRLRAGSRTERLI